MRGHQRGDVTNTQHITLHAGGQVKGCQGGCHYHSHSSHYYPVRVKSWNFSRLEKSGKITKYLIEILCCCRFRLEILRDDMALTQLSRGVWLVPHDNIILDIDEDFFGCEAAVTRFKRVRICVCVCVCVCASVQEQGSNRLCSCICVCI